MEGSIVLGWSKGDGFRHGGAVELPVSALTRHVSILGATGSGKSTTALVMVRELAKKGISAVILDRTGEYARALGAEEGIAVYKPGDNLVMAPFQFDADFSVGLQVEQWVNLLNHYATVTFGAQISPLQSRVLRSVLGQYYHGTQQTLTISSLITKLDAYERQVRQIGGWEESIQAVISRLVPLTVDLIGKTFDRPYSNLDLSRLFAGSVSIFDMSAIEDDGGKNLLSQMVLKRLYQRMKTLGLSDEVRVVLVLDEAQNLAPNGDYLSIPERCAIELRKYGFSLVTIATRPSLISTNILSNSSTVISHVLVNVRDIEALAGYLLEGSEDHVTKRALRMLPTGSAVVQKNYPVPERPVVCLVGMQGQEPKSFSASHLRARPASPSPSVTSPEAPSPQAGR